MRRHAHEMAEQVMWIVEGDVMMTVGDETKELVADDVVVVNPGIEHELVSEGAVTFMEALAPVLQAHGPMRSGIWCSARTGFAQRRIGAEEHLRRMQKRGRRATSPTARHALSLGLL